MTVKIIGNIFPTQWLWGQYEGAYLDSIKEQIQRHFKNQHSLLFNTTWLAPFVENKAWKDYQDIVHNQQNFDNLFLVATVDPCPLSQQLVSEIVHNLGNPRLYLLGNFHSPYEFNFFAPVLSEHFKPYTQQQLELKHCQWRFICYNRKPRIHRVRLVREMLAAGLDQHGIITLGKPDPIYDNDPTNNLYLTLGETCHDYVGHGHWYDLTHPDPTGIPHDVLSLHVIKYWQQHFLHVVGATMFEKQDDVFVSETQFKPIIGLRPFVINGNVQTYQWLRNNGFRTFETWFGSKVEDQSNVHQAIVELITRLVQMPNQEILDIYKDMLPTLIYNKDRFFEYASEQQHLINNLFGIDIKNS